MLVRKHRPWYPTDRKATVHPVEIEVEGAAGNVLKLPGVPCQIVWERDAVALRSLWYDG